MVANRQSLNPFASPAQSTTDLSDRASIQSDFSATSEIALSHMNRDGSSENATPSARAAFQPAHGEHVHNSRQAVFSSSSSISSLSQHSSSPSASSSAAFDRYNPSRLSAANASPLIGASHYASSRASSSSYIYPHALGDPTSAQGAVQNDPDFSPFGGYPVSSFPLHIDEKEADDYMHNPDPILDAEENAKWAGLDARGFTTLLTLLVMVLGAIAVFIILPVLTFTGHAGVPHNSSPVTDPLSSYKYGILKGIRTSLVDPDTPASALTRLNKDGKTMNLVFSDEFNKDGRTFYNQEDQFWQAVDIHYAATNDLEWYEPDAVTTANGTLVIRMDAFKNHNLEYRSGMLQSWNKLCFKGGAIEVSASLPGNGSKPGLWPGIWTMGNLGRPGYLATTDGVWPYAYNECDVGITPNQSSTDGISYLPGQRLNSCTCKGEDHPNPGTGRGCPEIDALEATSGNINSTYQVGLASQSLQVAPFDIWYMPNYDFIALHNVTTTSMNKYAGGPFQQAVSGVTILNNDWYNFQAFQKYGFEYEPGTESGYIQWEVGDAPTYTLYGQALGANGNIGPRQISEEPMSIILNLGISDSWAYIDWQSIYFPVFMYIDYVRIYQLEGNEITTCDPEGYPTTQYISNHPAPYANFNYTSWSAAGYDFPKNTLMDGCSM
ncbi:beta-glucan synthesis-associated protein-domain-containing protein [Lipomyces chichibuensis]|uniref:beta-glucan synthesis-associated protein-domain-containing protein n=1 Tax=Lipomyces chichibuensis TaxID=1546026 RepID=UPI0033441CAA